MIIPMMRVKKRKRNFPADPLLITIDQMLRMVDGLHFREAEALPEGGVRYYAEEENDVISPTFVLVREHIGSGGRTLIHVDAHRLSGAGDLADIVGRDIVPTGQQRPALRRQHRLRPGRRLGRLRRPGHRPGRSVC